MRPLVDPDDVNKAITGKTILISIMYANNEIGTIEPIAEIGQIAKQAGVCFHTDAVQAVGHVPIKVDNLGVDLLSMSAHKLYGPKGVGALYIKKGTKIIPLLHGGEQEAGRRAVPRTFPGSSVWGELVNWPGSISRPGPERYPVSVTGCRTVSWVRARTFE